MNKHIELVKKWLADKESVTREELEANANAAYAAVAADSYATCAYYASDAAEAAADYYAYAAEDADDADDADYYASKAKYWVRRYEELTK